MRVLFSSTRGAGHFNPLVPFIDGGSGTTLGALAAGLPLVVVPIFADQPENARRVHAVGAGIAVGPDPSATPEPIRSSVDPIALREAIEVVLGEPGFGRAARGLAQEMRALPATDRGLAALDQPARARQRA